MPDQDQAAPESLPGAPAENGDESSQSSDDVGPDPNVHAVPEASSSTKKKKKKKSKAMRALAALTKGNSQAVPQEVVDRVLQEVKDRPEAAGASETDVRAALEQMKIMDVAQGKSDIGGINRKDMGTHKFWETQPVPQIGEGPPLDDGFIEPSVPREAVRQEAYPLPKEFQWSQMDLDDPNQIKEVYDLLSSHYVEDKDASFRFQYSAEFLDWALKPPGFYKEWHIGVRVVKTGKLVAFISGVPMTLRVRTKFFQASEINYLCVHKRLRQKRLAPVLIKEVTRQCHLKGTFQAIYTAGVLLPTPVSICRYYHRSLNIPKLVDVNFTFVPRNMTLARMIKMHKLPETLQVPGCREMTVKDVDAVANLYSKYMQRFHMAPVMTPAEVGHQFLSGAGSGAPDARGVRDKQVVWTYVVESPTTHKITDFFSFYSLPSAVMNNPKHNMLDIAYLYYYASDIAFQDGADTDGRLDERLRELIGDALIVASRCKFDVFNALTLMDNVKFLSTLKFGQGDGHLKFYLYNWRTAPLAGMTAIGDVPAGRGVGVVML